MVYPPPSAEFLRSSHKLSSAKQEAPIPIHKIDGSEIKTESVPEPEKKTTSFLGRLKNWWSTSNRWQSWRLSREAPDIARDLGLASADFIESFRKRAKKLSNIARLKNLPQKTLKLLWEVLKYEDIREPFDRFLTQLQDISEISKKTGEPLASLMSEIMQQIANKETERIVANDFKQLMLDLFEIKTGMHPQFHTDSIQNLMPSLEGTSGIDTRFENQINNETKKQNENPVLSAQVKNAQEKSEAELGEKSRWNIGARTPGVGILTHAGWKDKQIPTQDKPSILYGLRTLGLAHGDDVVIKKVPLDFTELREIDEKKARDILTYVQQKSAYPDRDHSQLLKEFNDKERAIIHEKAKKFIDQTSKAISKMHTQLNRP